MKKKLLTIVATTAFALLLVGNAEAQSQKLKFQVPFAFSVGDTLIESGSYDVRMEANGILQIRSNDGKVLVSAQTQSAFSSVPLEHGKLMFNRYGNQYFLSKIFWPGFNSGREVPKSKEEFLTSVQATRAAALAIKPTPDVRPKKTAKF